MDTMKHEAEGGLSRRDSPPISTEQTTPPARLGWNTHFAAQFEQTASEGCQPARVSQQHRDLYRLLTLDGEQDGIVSGRLRHEASCPADFPAVGDWVVCSSASRPDATIETPCVIHGVLERQSCFSRRASGTVPLEQVIAANIDTLFLVSGLDNNFNLSRIERYTTQAWSSGAVPVVLLNKADLHPDPAAAAKEVSDRVVGVDVHILSAEQGDGVDDLRRYLTEGRTAAVVGSSGVGKSTLVNRLVGRAVLDTQAVREGDSRGRHTTTHRELIQLAEGGVLIDTPGMRELALWTEEATEPEEDEDSFEDIIELARRCRYPDCQHRGEPDCAVWDAMASGDLDGSRVRSFRLLHAERYETQRRKRTSKHRQRANAQSKRQAKRAERRSIRQQLGDDEYD